MNAIDYSAMAQFIAETMLKCGEPLSDGQRLLLAGAVGVWVEKEMVRFRVVVSNLKEQALTHDAIEYAAGNLPEGYNVEISLENGYGSVALIDAEGEQVELQQDDTPFAMMIREAVDKAVEMGVGA